MNRETIKEFVIVQGANVCGIAPVERFHDAPKGFHPSELLSNARSVIIFGKQFPAGTFRSGNHAPYTMARNQLIQFNDTLALDLSFKIEEEGFIALPIPSSEPYEYWDPTRRHGRGILSLKHAAELAGLGRIGKNTLLINEKFGNRLWLGGVITNAELEPDSLSDAFCIEDCRICIEACPQSALDETTIDQKKCREICFTSTEGGGWMIACNICRTECPYSLV
jgi:epoxyqueuosine reductase